MALEIGTKVKVTCLDETEYVGKLTNICIGIDPDNPTQASIILQENENEKMQVHIWCNGIKNIEPLTL